MQELQPTTQQLVRTVLAPQYKTTPKANGSAGGVEPAEDDVKFFFDFEQLRALIHTRTHKEKVARVREQGLMQCVYDKLTDVRHATRVHVRSLTWRCWPIDGK